MNAKMRKNISINQELYDDSRLLQVAVNCGTKNFSKFVQVLSLAFLSWGDEERDMSDDFKYVLNVISRFPVKTE